MSENNDGTDKFQFDIEFQKKILKLMIDDPNVLIRIKKFCKKDYFANDYLEWVYTNIIEYYEKYQKVITMQVFAFNAQQLSKSGRNPVEFLSIVQDIFSKNIEEKEFILDKLREWLSVVTYVKGANKAAEYFKNHHHEKAFEISEKAIIDAKMITFETPNRSFFFNEIEERIFKRNAFLQKDDYKFTTGVLPLDELTNGGLSRGELGIVAADAKKGKSIFLLNAGAATVITGFNVLHISLEGKDLQVDSRYDAKFLSLPYRDVTQNSVPSERYETLKRFNKSLVITNLTKSFDYTVDNIEEEIQNLKAHNFFPDLLIVDYGDLLKPRKADPADKYKGQEEVFQDLKVIATKHNIGVWTATQCHRVDRKIKDPDEDSTFFYTRHTLADSYSKVRMCDLLITLNRTRIENDNNKMRVYVDAYRDNECGKILNVTTDYKKMQFYIASQEDIQNYHKGDTHE